MSERTSQDTVAKIRPASFALLVTLLLVGASSRLPGLSPLYADDGGQAALVIQYADAQVEALCVPFEEESISGMELLDRSGLALIVQPGSSLGITICQIEEVGCAYPAKACFCQCMGGGACAYWNYFHRDSGEDWTYAPLGAVMRQVRPGAVESWVWGDGTEPPADHLTYQAICQTAAETATETPVPTATSISMATRQPEVGSLAEPVRATETVASVAPTPTPSPMPEAAAEAGPGLGLSSYGVFAAMVLALVGIGLWVRRRQD